MRLAKRSQFAVIGLVVLCGYVGVRFLTEPISETSARRPAGSVWFNSYSNSPSGERWALLTVTNRDTCDLVFVGPYSIEFNPSHTNDAELDDRAQWQVPASIAPGFACLVAIKATHDERPWRARFFLRRFPMQDKLKERLPHSMDWVVTGTHGWQISDLATPWISP